MWELGQICSFYVFCFFFSRQNVLFGGLAVNSNLLWTGRFGLLSSPVELISAAAKNFLEFMHKDGSHPWWKHINTCAHTETQKHKHSKRMQGCIQSNFTLLFSVPVSLFPVDSFTPNNLLQGHTFLWCEKPCGKTQERLQNDKQMTCSTTSSI